MSARTDRRAAIAAALKALESQPLADAGRQLFATLGYQSDRCIPISTPQQFREQLDPHEKLTGREGDALDQVNSLHLLFQLTNAELDNHGDMFDDGKAVETTKIESYLFFAAELPSGHYTRTALSTLVRAVNKPLPMPALVLFRHGDTVSIGIIHRRLHKRDQARDVLEKVTLIKDITFADPIRAHLEILNDFVLDNLDADFGVSNFVRLHEAWQRRLGSYALSNDFYREIADWYFWAHHQVHDGAIRLPQHCDTDQEKSLFLIRLLTRVIFCWFLVEKRLIPTDLFREHRLKVLLKEFNPNRDPKKPDGASTYYHAILQNLFFGTLNMPSEQRGFRDKKKSGERYDKNYGITNLWRYETDFRTPADWLTIAARVPFLNGGLFDCLDDKVGKRTDNFILDGFSDNAKLACHLPNDLFFGHERTVDLSRDYGEEDKRTARSKKAKARGLIEILSRYKFTIEENTPLEEEIALDPELLGKVFENLLASYNEDTQTTARKALGAYYTPREIVSYMVDEALKSYLGSQVPNCKGALEDIFPNNAILRDIRTETRDALIAAIGRAKIIDPACGSGAFLMGALHRLVDLLQKLDEKNIIWRDLQRRRAIAETEEAFKSGDRDSREQRLQEINNTFEFNSSDYGRKLYLIENCIYGVDIQPIATQIAKLRFFISLIVDQKVNSRADNLGVRPLPNLETRLVAADTLIPIEKSRNHQFDLLDAHIRPLRHELEQVRHEHFNARNPAAKRRCRDRDEKLRAEIADLLKQSGFPAESAGKLAGWDPYDQNAFAPFFDSEWMFGLPVGKVQIQGRDPRHRLGNLALINQAAGQTELTAFTSEEIDSGFDIVIGNPPYGATYTADEKARFNRLYEHQDYQIDSYLLFIERGMQLLKGGGVQALIVSNTWLPSLMFRKIREFIFASTQVISILDVVTKVFAAVVDTTVLIHSKGTPSSNHEASVFSFRDAGINHEYRIKQAAWYSAEGRPVSIQATPQLQRIIETMENNAALGGPFKVTPGCKPFQVGKGRPPQTRRIVDEKPFISDRKKNNSFRPLLRGRLIGRFANYWKGNYWISFGEWLAEPRHTANYDSPEKIVVRQTGDSLIATLDESQFVVMNNMFTVVPSSDRFAIKYVLAVINSVPANWFYQTAINPEKGEALAEIKRGHLVRVPIPNATAREQAAAAALADILLRANRLWETHESARTARDQLMLAYLERVLSGLVYELYFPEEVHGAGLRLFELVEQAGLPSLDAIPEPDRLSRLRQIFETLYDGAHPLRIALDKLQTLDTVRIIEGKA